MARGGPQRHRKKKYPSYKIQAVYCCSELLTSYQTTLCHKTEHVNKRVCQATCTHGVLKF